MKEPTVIPNPFTQGNGTELLCLAYENPVPSHMPNTYGIKLKVTETHEKCKQFNDSLLKAKLQSAVTWIEPSGG